MADWKKIAMGGLIGGIAGTAVQLAPKMAEHLNNPLSRDAYSKCYLPAKSALPHLNRDGFQKQANDYVTCVQNGKTVEIPMDGN